MLGFHNAGGLKHHGRGRSSRGLMDRGKILSRLDIKAGETVLDAACGDGHMAKDFSRLVGRRGKVYALDSNTTDIAGLRETTEGTNILPVVGDITAATPLPEAEFDLIYLSMAFHIFSPEKIKGFEAEVRRLLTPSGKLAIVEIVNRPTPIGPPAAMRLSAPEITRLLSLAPMETVDVGEYFYMQIFENRPIT